MVPIIYANGKDEYAFLDRQASRQQQTDANVEQTVKGILSAVQTEGDAALLRFAKQFDQVEQVKCFTKPDFLQAYQKADAPFRRALKKAANNITAFHKKQMPKDITLQKADGSWLKQTVRGLSSVGLYVPGGTAAYPSSVLMNAIPAKIAGVERLVMVTPPTKTGGANPDILVAAHLSGVDELWLVGGAHAVAALAYGTTCVPRVDKIVGPGNIYVATAKRMVFGAVDIDMVAGPSEITIVADQTAQANHLAADMLSQAEHDKLASSILITDSEQLALDTQAAILEQISKLPRAEFAREALQNCGGILVLNDMAQAAELVNRIAPEHLEIITADPMQIAAQVKNAGSVFLGAYSPEPLGDYFAGTNHVLPTSGTARYASPLSVESFVKRMQTIYYTKESLFAAANDIVTIAKREGLDAHANAILERLND